MVIDAGRPPSLERAGKPLQVCDLRQRFALLLAPAHGHGRVAEREDRQHLQLLRDVQQRLDRLQPSEADPVLWLRRGRTSQSGRYVTVTRTLTRPAPRQTPVMLTTLRRAKLGIRA